MLESLEEHDEVKVVVVVVVLRLEEEWRGIMGILKENLERVFGF